MTRYDPAALPAVLSAALLIGIAIWSLRQRGEAASVKAGFFAALAATGVWAGFSDGLSPFVPRAVMLETVRNALWLGYLWCLSRQLGGTDFSSPARLAYKLLAVLVAARLAFALLERAGMLAIGADAVAALSIHLGLVLSVGLLALVPNASRLAQRRPVQRAHATGYGPTVAGLVALWAFDLNAYAISFFTGTPSLELFAMRPALSLLLVPLFAVRWTHGGQAQLSLSRLIAVQSIGLVAIGGYLLAVALATALVRSVGGAYAPLIAQAVLIAGIAGLVVILPSRRLRGWLRVKVTKHFFRHRYDYREEWIRFTDTVGRPPLGTNDRGSLEERAIRAVADIMGSPAGALMLPDEADGLTLEHGWRWPMDCAAALGASAAPRTLLMLQNSERVIEFDALRHGLDAAERAELPDWMVADLRIWAGVPLMHYNRLTGLVLLARPQADRRLDWEDFDLLKIVGRQVASYLSEARGQDALSEARKFDEFNRRFAFIMHDLKNLVSQLSLVARNAERHAANPEFRRDMVETLRLSAGRMNALLARLSHHGASAAAVPQPVDLRVLVDGITARRSGAWPLSTGEETVPAALADPAQVEQILIHLIQNAVDASMPGSPVEIALRADAGRVGVDVRDHGIGMTPDFVRHELFKPFASTKEGGFGIGAYEARSLAMAMNGRLEVESAASVGTRFTLWLPQADAEPMETDVTDVMKGLGA